MGSPHNPLATHQTFNLTDDFLEATAYRTDILSFTIYKGIRIDRNSLTNLFIRVIGKTIDYYIYRLFLIDLKQLSKSSSFTQNAALKNQSLFTLVQHG